MLPRELTTDLPTHSRRRGVALAGLLSGALLVLVALAAPSAWAWEPFDEAAPTPAESNPSETPAPAGTAQAPTAEDGGGAQAGGQPDSPTTPEATPVAGADQPDGHSPQGEAPDPLGSPAAQQASDLLEEIHPGADEPAGPKDTVTGELRSLLTVSGAPSTPSGADPEPAPTSPPLWAMREPDQIKVADLPDTDGAEAGGDEGEPPQLGAPPPAAPQSDPPVGTDDWRGEWAAVKELEARQEQIADIESSVVPELPEIRHDLTAARLRVAWVTQAQNYLADVADAQATYDAAKAEYDARMANARDERFSIGDFLDPSTWFGVDDRYAAAAIKTERLDEAAEKLEVQQHDAYAALPQLSGWLGLERTGVPDAQRQDELDMLMDAATEMVAQPEKEEYLATAKVGAVAAGELWPLISDRNRAGLHIDGHSRDMAEQAFEDAKQHRHDVEDELGTLLPSALDYEQRRADLRLELEVATGEQDRAWELLEAAEERIERWGQRP